MYNKCCCRAEERRTDTATAHYASEGHGETKTIKGLTQKAEERATPQITRAGKGGNGASWTPRVYSGLCGKTMCSRRRKVGPQRAPFKRGGKSNRKTRQGASSARKEAVEKVERAHVRPLTRSEQEASRKRGAFLSLQEVLGHSKQEQRRGMEGWRGRIGERQI